MLILLIQENQIILFSLGSNIAIRSSAFKLGVIYILDLVIFLRGPLQMKGGPLTFDGGWGILKLNILQALLYQKKFVHTTAGKRKILEKKSTPGLNASIVQLVLHIW